MRVVVVGGSGHIGTFLVPRLVRAGHEVINISRGVRGAHLDAPEWEQVRRVVADRQREDEEGTFGDRVAGLAPDVVVDLVCFTLDSATALVDSLRRRAGHLLHCGSIWRHGPSHHGPISETSGTRSGRRVRHPEGPHRPDAEGGDRLPTPGHIVGPGWPPIGPLGNLDPAVWHALSAGHPLRIPGIGAELMHHVHADDVAHAFEQAVAHRDTAAGEDFNIVAPHRAERPRVRPRGRGLVRADRVAGAGELGGVPPDHDAGARGDQLGAPLPQPLHQHREGQSPARLRTALRTRSGRARISPLADRTRRAGGGPAARRLTEHLMPSR
ncbi:nucleoside-diphosphate-sugar epimerase [Lentzea atacamensis]|uniref:Nucleoside-diphosphate-sugar epimerase n=1 Tax=Lentzea atacamensis TaxID=531938 RepID=A0ABX9EJY9_9PSEU|nr:nucleoside-diphosphate-sugar epimerase [Lentzea atacamensis]